MSVFSTAWAIPSARANPGGYDGYVNVDAIPGTTGANVVGFEGGGISATVTPEPDALALLIGLSTTASFLLRRRRK